MRSSLGLFVVELGQSDIQGARGQEFGLHSKLWSPLNPVPKPPKP